MKTWCDGWEAATGEKQWTKLVEDPDLEKRVNEHTGETEVAVMAAQQRSNEKDS